MKTCLQHVNGLSLQNGNSYVAVSKLGEEALDATAEAIGILVDASALRAACTLMRMCKPSVRLTLLKKCRHDHIEELTSSEDEAVRQAMDQALNAAAHDALSRKDFAQFFKLLRYCSPEARANLNAWFPSLTTDTAQALTDHEVCEVASHWRTCSPCQSTWSRSRCLNDCGDGTRWVPVWRLLLLMNLDPGLFSPMWHQRR